jgi:carbonic anhydrase/acetyltransferase-like protein (isoleucine patch superfamily)
MLQAYLDKSPQLLGAVRAHATSVVIGAVTLGEGVSLWPQTVLRGDYNTITVGRGSNIQDGAVVHNDHTYAAVIGEDCVVGHRAIVHGSTVGDRCLIGMGAILLNGSVIGDECIIGAGAVVPEGKVIPPRSLVLGLPGKIMRPVTDEEVAKTVASAGHYRGYAERQLPLAG